VDEIYKAARNKWKGFPKKFEVEEAFAK